jgi:outer membrane lipoprotein carrier protein
VDLRQGPEPGHGQKARQGARRQPGSAARRQQRNRKAYDLTNLGPQEGLDWLEAIPKTKDTTFERVRLGFGKAGLEAMELRDQFAQTTVIKFANVERNPKLSPEVFRFTPPKGADVITD